jgi:IS5 family transposase
MVVVVGAVAQSRIAYDDFCGLDRTKKIRIFNDIGPENRAELVRTQIQRWLDKNKARLSPEQIQLMMDNIAFIKADLYKIPRREEDLAKAKELEQRALALMTREDMTEAMTMFGACIAKGS